MRVEKKFVRRALLAGIAALCIFSISGYVIFPNIIVNLYGKDVPPQWSGELSTMNFHQIHERLGPPQGDASAKDFQDWYEYHWWGVKALRIAAHDCCKPDSQPDEIDYMMIVHRKAVYIKPILQAKH